MMLPLWLTLIALWLLFLLTVTSILVLLPVWFYEMRCTKTYAKVYYSIFGAKK